MQGVEGSDRELRDAAQVVGHLVPVGSMFGFLADHRGDVFPDEQYADLFSTIGRPSLPAKRMAAVIVAGDARVVGPGVRRDGPL